MSIPVNYGFDVSLYFRISNLLRNIAESVLKSSKRKILLL